MPNTGSVFLLFLLLGSFPGVFNPAPDLQEQLMTLAEPHPSLLNQGGSGVKTFLTAAWLKSHTTDRLLSL